MNKALGRPENEWSDSVKRRIDRAVEILLHQTLLAGEAPLPAPIRGTSGFAEHFAQQGPFDQQGRSLRQFDLQKRTFRYPMTFLVYSDAFAQLPAVVLEKFRHRLGQVLAHGDPAYPHLTPRPPSGPSGNPPPIPSPPGGDMLRSP